MRFYSSFILPPSSLFLLLAGCGGDGLVTYAIAGKVVLADGDIRQLADHHVEFMLESDSTVRADGKIEPDGRFVVQMLHKGKLLKGAPEGTYLARIILDESDAGPKRGKRPVHERFLDFKKSGLSIKVPASGEITVSVSRR